VLIGRRAAAAGDDHQLVHDVASSIIGGGFGARLDNELHEKLGLTIGASASYWRGRWAGSWALATTFATDKTLAGIRAALAVLDRARDVSADELAAAKTNLIAAAQLSFETTAATARAFERVVAQDLPVDWFAMYAKGLAAITLADVRAASSWTDLSIVVVGDRAKLEPVLSDLALPITHYDRDGTKQ
jgi:zinc protease